MTNNDVRGTHSTESQIKFKNKMIRSSSSIQKDLEVYGNITEMSQIVTEEILNPLSLKQK